MSPSRGYTPPDASLETFLALHRALGGIERAVLTQPSVYGTDNSCMLDAVEAMGAKFMAVAAVDADVTDRELEALHARRVRGARVNIVDKGGMPFDGIEAVRRFTERLEDLGWHLEVLIHVHEFEDLRATLNSMAVDVSVGHLGYMRTDHGIDHPGFREFLDLVRDGKCWVKLSGSYRVTTMGTTPYTDVAPYARALIEANEDRVIWGTDWPHPALKGNMPNDGALMDQLSEWAPDETVRRKIMVDNSETLYGFER
jgi:predicted TIM-barrel fold metal-dependent hydrolase